MAMKSQLICRYFKKDGFCSKGDYCEYTHTKTDSIDVCKFFSSKTECPFGRSCSFRHVYQRGGNSSVRREGSTRLTLIHSVEKPDTIQESKNFSHSAKPSVINSWGLSEDESEGIYFYGAPGTSIETKTLKTKDYSALARRERLLIESQSRERLSLVSESQTSAQKQSISEGRVCYYYLLNSCRYGLSCRFLHPSETETEKQNSTQTQLSYPTLATTSIPSSCSLSGESATSTVSPVLVSPTSSSFTISNDQEKEVTSINQPDTFFCTTSNQVKERNDSAISAATVECGICMSAPEDGRLGVLSHCQCIFCIKCIRQWRKTGGIVSGADQTRLCPLCRVESYFVIPSSHIVNSSEKEQFVSSYIANMRRIPCKHYREGSCPFGSSCFYLHVSLDGTTEQLDAPRHLLNAQQEVEVHGSMMLADFVAPRNS
mmetsp:Transcript_10015/g.10125  ORF Transcript_10015/g.10125 Transcript_10015/m.10125 type:complete len:430 (+) Transcript_10015:222-1511(+)